MTGEFLRRWPLFPVALALYPVLHVAATHPGQSDATAVLLVSAAAAAASALCVLLLRPLLGSWYRAGLATWWAVLLFFSYGIVATWLQAQFRPEGSVAFAVRGCCDPRVEAGHAAAWWVLLGLGVVLAWRLPRDNARVTLTLNVASLAALAAVASLWIAGLSGDPSSRRAVATASPVGADAPDVYHIVLDAYARADVLADQYGYDNARFLDGLRRLGFTVLGNSRSNYYWTDLSLPSMLNFDYLPPLLGDAFDAGSVDRTGVYRLTRDNAVAAFLRARGYRTYHLESTFAATGRNPYADVLLSCSGSPFSDDFVRALAEVSWLHAFRRRATLDLAECHLRNFEALAEVAARPGPKFVFAHFIPPHHPYLFDREGNVLRDATLSSQFDFQSKLWQDRQGYLDQLDYLSRRIERAIEEIVARSQHPALVILVSDHGPNLRGDLPREAQHRVRFANLVAVRMPGAPPGWLPDDLTLVNLYRHVLNRAFDARLPVLPDRHFVSEFRRPFAWVEVGPDGRMPAATPD